MRKQTLIAAVLLLVAFPGFSIPIRSQNRVSFTRTSLSKMDVLSRAELFEKTITDAARKEGVDPLILWTIAYNETRFRPWLTSPKNAQGLMQFIPATAKRFGLANPYEPTASIFAAARYVKYLDGLFERKIESVLAAYNSGEGTVLAYLHGRTLSANGKHINTSRRRTINGVPPYRETIGYVANGKRIYRWLETQGRFPGFKNGASADSIGRTLASERSASEAGDSPVAATVTVLYDPRSGNRYLVSDRGELRSIKQGGDVIVSPEVRGLPTQNARSTFAGIPP
ncbi:MAG: transglycosylase SLT domain-containing protein [Acidobacteria bacterium]|nr:transglycosylase SLT domain-containing protein [Acidobacteriota bacterium]